MSRRDFWTLFLCGAVFGTPTLFGGLWLLHIYLSLISETVVSLQ